mgnify:CR=1 FL=1
MNCPKCGKPMLPNTNKKNPKAPDWKCGDPNCKFKWDSASKDWVPSDWVTGAWNDKNESSFKIDRIADLEKRVKIIEDLLRTRWNVEVNG